MVAIGLAFLVGYSPPAQARSMEQIMAEATRARDAGELDRVVKLLLEAYEVNPAPALLNNLGRIYEQLGRYGDAYAAYKKVFGIHPEPRRECNVMQLTAGGSHSLARA